MPSTRRISTWMLAFGSAVFSINACADGGGLRPATSDELWPRWQARALTTTSFSLWRHAASDHFDASYRRQESLSLFGDYYFSQMPLSAASSGGFRATSGLIIGQPGSQALSTFSGHPGSDPGRAMAGTFEARSFSTHLSTTPYLGLGYTNLSPKSGWGFSADIGIVAGRGSRAGQFGRVLSGSQTLDDLLREVRLSPLLNIGVSYSF
jgi:hypothetical protein